MLVKLIISLSINYINYLKMRTIIKNTYKYVYILNINLIFENK